MTSSAPRIGCYDWAETFSLHLRAPIVIDYETFCRIHDCQDRQSPTIAQTACELGLQPDHLTAALVIAEGGKPTTALINPVQKSRARPPILRGQADFAVRHSR
jgi:hypothetical protein